MAKISFFSPVTHRFAAEQVAKLFDAELHIVGPDPSWKRQHFRSYRMILAPEQSKKVRHLMRETKYPFKIDSFIKALVEGYKVLIDDELIPSDSPQPGDREL